MAETIEVMIVGAIISIFIFFLVEIVGLASKVDSTITLILACVSAFGTLVVTIKIGLGRG